MSFSVSIGIICVVFFLCDTLRSKLRQSNAPQRVKTFVGDFLVTIEQFVGTLEQGVIYERYGRVVWSLGTFLIAVYQCMRFKENLPNPIVHFHSLFISKTLSLKDTLLRIACLMACGIFVFKVIMSSIWALGLSKYHLNRIEFLNGCAVPNTWNPFLSFLAETLGSLALCVVPKLLSDSPSLQNSQFKRSLLTSLFVIIVINFAFDISGGMYNPVLATVLLGGCKGLSHKEHIAIYWVGATIGSLGGALIYPYIKALVFDWESNKATKKRV